MRYGTCPHCESSVLRRVKGNDMCEEGHVFPSSETIPDQKPKLVSRRDKAMFILGMVHAFDASEWPPHFSDEDMSRWKEVADNVMKAIVIDAHRKMGDSSRTQALNTARDLYDLEMRDY